MGAADLAKEYVDRHGTDSTGGEATHEVLRRWEQVLAGLERDPWNSPTSSTGSPNSDSSRATANGTASRGATPSSGRWTSSTPTCVLTRGLRGGLASSNSSPTPRRSRRSASRPPNPCLFPRALHRHVPEQVVAANWDSLVFDVGSDALRRVPMMEPMRGTRAHVGTLFDECESAAELLRRLGT